jgi:class 3 adenylate cyclase
MRVLAAVALGMLALMPGVALGQMGATMGPRAASTMGPRDVAAPERAPATSSERSPRPAAGAAMSVSEGQAVMSGGMEHGSTPRPFYQEGTFLVLLGAAGAAGAIVVYRVIRRRRHRPAAPSGFVTEAVFVVDVVGSTHLATQYGEAVAMQARTAIKDRVMAAADGRGLRFVESTGDGCLATFATVASAVATARAVLDGLRTQPPDLAAPAPPLAVRVGITWGEILLDDRGARHGAVINKAFRLEGVRPEAFVRMEGEPSAPAIAERNRIFLDEAAAEEARIDGAAVREVGFARLKGFPDLHRVCEVTA